MDRFSRASKKQQSQSRLGVYILAGVGLLMVALVFFLRSGPSPARAEDGILKPVGKQTQTTREAHDGVWHTMWVTATAYNSLKDQTDSTPNLAAWGDTLEPGMRAIAVSRDLIPLGLDHNTKVYLEEDPKPYLVLDKMNKRWRDRIDIYMGVDRTKALSWGKKRIRIRWQAATPSSEPTSEASDS